MKTSPLYLAALAVSAIEGLEIVGTRPPYIETSDFVTGVVVDSRGRRWVVKAPLNDAAATMLEAEAALAPSLLDHLRRGDLPFDIIRPSGFADVQGGGRAVVYREPFGEAIPFENLTDAEARELGRAIASIHVLPESAISASGLPVYTADECRQRLLAELHDADQVSPVPAILRRRWENALEDTSLWQFDPVPLHGDVASENFFWSRGEIATVLGFGESHVGDPATDLAPLIGMGDEFFEAVRESYQNTRHVEFDDAAYSRAVLASELAVVRWLMYGHRLNDTEIVRDAQAMLSELATDVENEGSLGSGPSWHVDPAGQ
ncbi:phosphotransferase [Changpingibacter yushuensis]|uniref:phosphotransferase n=1 Tax=Changpingibacter yushuensis TaxID=2758440 RepID=UPI0015F4F6DE|nr:phosphotransferase [Changpingibacter yushuensis]